jgi:hypothetical protein
MKKQKKTSENWNKCTLFEIQPKIGRLENVKFVERDLAERMSEVQTSKLVN